MLPRLQVPFAALALALFGACAPTPHEAALQEAAAPLQCDVKAFGAVGDGKHRDTAALQAAIDACGDKGGVVLIHDGTFLTGMVRLHSNMTLRIAAGATLRGTQDAADYPDTTPATTNSQLNNCRKALVYAEGVHDLTIDGQGTIDGSGDAPQWTGPNAANPERTRPIALYVTLSQRVTVQDLTITRSAMWTLVTLETDHVIIRGVTVRSPQGPTRDGIDIVDDHDVLVENVTVDSEDDAICIKSGADRGVEDVVVRDSHVVRSRVAQGLKIGTATVGHVARLTFERIKIDAVDKAAMAVESIDGSRVEDVTFRDVTFQHAGAALFVLLGKRASSHQVGTISGVRFERVTGQQTAHAWGSTISGTILDGVTHRPEGVHLVGVHVTSVGGATTVPPTPPEYAGQYPDPNLWGNVPAFGLYVRHASDVTLDDTTFDAATSDARPAVVRDDVLAAP